MKIFSVIFLFLIALFSLQAQQNISFSVSVSSDSILLGNQFEARFTLKNAKGENFQAPIFDEFDVISGPNTSSSATIINGAMTQSITYTYRLRPRDIGNYFIPPASVEIEGNIVETQPLEIMVVPNPDGILQSPNYAMPSRPFDYNNLFDSDQFLNFDFGFGNDFFENPDSLFNQYFQDMRKLLEGSPFLNGEEFQFPDFEQFFPRDTIIQEPKKRKTYRL